MKHFRCTHCGAPEFMTAKEFICRMLLTLGVGALVFGLLFFMSGCVRSVTVCTTFDHRMGKETPERYARDNMGASVCAELEPPRLVRPAPEPAEPEAEPAPDAGTP